jgi:hypothetical protein
VYRFAIPYLLHSKHCSKETGTKTGQDQGLLKTIPYFEAELARTSAAEG